MVSFLKPLLLSEAALFDIRLCLEEALINAMKYGNRLHEDLSVDLEVEAGPEEVRLTVQDQGAGIAPEDMGRLFQPFARLERTRHMAKGTGLGLVSTKKIVEAHGGAIAVRSVPDQGTTVELRLPLAEDANAN